MTTTTSTESGEGTTGDPGTEIARPDFVYDPDEWECTYEWGDRYSIAEELSLEPGEIKPFGTLRKGPDVFLAHVVVSRDDAGEPDEMEYRWFNTREEAEAVVGKQCELSDHQS